MRTLAIETATEACSVALFDGDTMLAHDHQVLGRGHAERLVPAIAALPDRGKADRILVSLGPGSFTGVRIGIATARALGVAWGAEVLGYQTLALVAARCWQPSPQPVTVCMNGGHGQWFVQNYDQGKPQDEVRSLEPEQAMQACRHSRIAGNRAEELAAMFAPGEKVAIDMLPDASKLSLLHDSNWTSDLSPIYGRPSDAKPAATSGRQ